MKAYRRSSTHSQPRNSMAMSDQLEAPASSPLVPIERHVHRSNADDYNGRYLCRENPSPITGPRLELWTSQIWNSNALPSRMAIHNIGIKQIALKNASNTRTEIYVSILNSHVVPHPSNDWSRTQKVSAFTTEYVSRKSKCDPVFL